MHPWAGVVQQSFVSRDLPLGDLVLDVLEQIFRAASSVMPRSRKGALHSSPSVRRHWCSLNQPAGEHR